MALRSRGPLAGIGWLKRAILPGRGNAKAVFGGAALLCVAILLPVCITLPMQFGTLEGDQPSPTFFFAGMAISTLLGLLVMPAYGGYLRVIDAVERGQPARARDVFAPYRQGEVLRFVGYGLAMTVVYFALLGAVIGAMGGGLARWYVDVVASGGQPAAMPELPPGFGLALALLGLAGLFLVGTYSISLGQVSLRGRSVLGAIGDGLVGSLKNLLPLLVFAVSLVLAWLVFALCIGVAGFVLAMLAGLVGNWLLVVMAVPAYIALVCVLMVVMFRITYHLWRDVCGDDAATPDLDGALAA